MSKVYNLSKLPSGVLRLQLSECGIFRKKPYHRTLIAVCLLALSVSGFSQTPDLSHGRNWNNLTVLSPGTEVRLELSGSHFLQGSVHSVTDDSLAVDSASGQETFTRQQVMRASVRKQSNRGRNALIGLGVGGGVGLGFVIAPHSSSSSICCSAGATVAFDAAVGAIIGALVPTGGWREIYRQ